MGQVPDRKYQVGRAMNMYEVGFVVVGFFPIQHFADSPADKIFIGVEGHLLEKAKGFILIRSIQEWLDPGSAFFQQRRRNKLIEMNFFNPFKIGGFFLRAFDTGNKNGLAYRDHFPELHGYNAAEGDTDQHG